MRVPPFHLLPRPRITATLTSAMMNHPFLVISAPMGYGKTTAARDLAKALGDQALFLTVPPGPHSISNLWQAATGRLRKKGVIASARRCFGVPSDTIQMQRFIELCRLGTNPAFVILDDYHHITDPAVDTFFDTLAREHLPGFHIALFSRTRPGIPLDELQLKGLAAFFDQELFAFTQIEARDFFRIHGSFNTAHADEAWQYSEGWAAELRLSLRHRITHGTAHLRRDTEALLGDTVFATCSTEEKNILMQLSVLDSFTAEEAVGLTHTPRARRMLRELHDRNVFVAYAPATDSYHIHGIFRSFLAKALEASNLVRPTLFRRAGECMVARNDPLPAIRLFRRAGRNEDLLRVLEVLSQENAKRLPLIFTDEAMAETIPWRLRLKRPMEYLAHIYFRIVECGDPLAAMLLDEAEEHFKKSKCISEATKKRLAGEILFIKSMLAFNDLDAMVAIQKKAHRLLHGRSAIASRSMLWTFGCPHATYLYLHDSGTYRELIGKAENGLQYIHALSDGCFMGAKPLFRAEWLLEQTQFDEINGLLAAARSRAKSKEQTTSLLLADFVMARRLAATGIAATSPAGLEKWIQEIQAIGNADLSSCLELALGYVYSCLSRCDEIPGWLREGEVKVSQYSERILGFIHVVRGKAALAAGDYGRADAIAKMLPASLGSYNNLFGRIHAKALEAAAAAHLRNTDTAIHLLRDALTLARPDGIVLTLAEYGAELLTVLRAMPEVKSSDGYFRRLLTYSERYARIGAKGRRGLAGAHGLTPRERELVCLVAKGHSNHVIARRLGISEGTVKKILISAYGKLQARNRAEAVRKFLETKSME